MLHFDIRRSNRLGLAWGLNTPLPPVPRPLAVTFFAFPTEPRSAGCGAVIQYHQWENSPATVVSGVQAPGGFHLEVAHQHQH